MSQAATTDPSKKHPSHVAYAVRDGKDGKAYWNRVGVAWATKDGKGFSVQLDAVPLDGRVLLREPDASA